MSHRSTSRFVSNEYNGNLYNVRESYVSWLRNTWGYSLSDVKTFVLRSPDNESFEFSDFDSMMEKCIELQKLHPNYVFDIVPYLKIKED